MKSELTPTKTNQSVVVYGTEPILRHPIALFKSMMRDIAASKELAWRLFVRDISAKYRQSILGYVWAFLPPIATTAAFVFLRSSGVFKLGEVEIPYALFLMVGMVLWQTFVDAMRLPLNAITAAKPMLAKINFPREAILLAALGEVLFNFLIRVLLLIVVFAWFQTMPSASAWLFPVGVLGIIVLGFTIGVLITPFGLLYTDVAQGLTLATTFWLFVTPVLYPAAKEGAATILSNWNPVSPIVITARHWLTIGPVDNILPFTIVCSMSVVLLFLGWILYRVAMPHLIARMGG